LSLQGQTAINSCPVAIPARRQRDGLPGIFTHSTGPGASSKKPGLSGRFDRKRAGSEPGNLNAQVAQSVEQRTENPRVAGSIPALGTSLRRAAAETATA
jgi:hypothetical protein